MLYPIAPRVLTFSVLTGWFEAPIPYGVGYSDAGVPVPADFTGWTTEGGLYDGETLVLDMASTTGNTALTFVPGELNICTPQSAVGDLTPGQYQLALRFVDDHANIFPALAAVVVVTNP